MNYNSYEIRVLQEPKDCQEEGNIDVVVEFDSGQRFGATFFTLDNIAHLFRKNAETGECLNGLYFWSTHMIVVQRLNRWTIERTVENLLESGEFESAFERFLNEAQNNGLSD